MSTYQINKLPPFGGLSRALGNKNFWLGFILIVLTFVSAIGVVYIQAMNRIMFSEVQNLQKQHDHLQVEWGQLLLEQSAWGTPLRVQRIAQEKLHMFLPKHKKIVIIKE